MSRHIGKILWADLNPAEQEVLALLAKCYHESGLPYEYHRLNESQQKAATQLVDDFLVHSGGGGYTLTYGGLACWDHRENRSVPDVKTDYEVLKDLLKKLPLAERNKVNEDLSLVESTLGDDIKSAINIRVNGFLFNDQGDLVGTWAEYD